MSFRILDHQNQVAVSYDAEKRALAFQNTILENDIKGGLRLPTYLQEEMGNRTFLPYPPDDCDIALFVKAYKEVIFGGELVKHGYTLHENAPPKNSQKV
ncbi:MAG: hypothetical protein AB7N99_03980 [Simkaniaceae bacterium]